MIENVPLWIGVLFLGTTLLTIVLFYFLNGKPWKLLALVIGYAVLQSVLSATGFYLTEGFPPRSFFLLVPIALMVLYGVTGKRLDWAVQNRRIASSYFLHVVRVPVEIVLLRLYMGGAVPQLMTFEGRNFDIVVGIIAPLIGLLFLKRKISLKGLLFWNFVGLGFVLFIVVNAVLSIESPFQLFAFEQPNRAVLYFPYVLLPAIIVPIVIYTHLSDIGILLRKIKSPRKHPGIPGRIPPFA